MNIFKQIYRLLAVGAVMLCASCSVIYDDSDSCEVSLQFIYDHNMEYADAFNPQVNSVDVYVFNNEGTYLFKKTSQRVELTDGNKMILTGDLTPGTYKILTVGGLSNSFTVSDASGNSSLTPGAFNLEEMKITLMRNTSVVNDEFPSLWFGKSIVITHDNQERTWPVQLIKETNEINISLINQSQSSENNENMQRAAHPYSFEIITPEGAVYSWENSPLSNETVTYTPYQTDTDNDGVSTARIKTCRLFDTDQYKLVIRNQVTSELVWEYDLIKLLKYSKPSSRPDGTLLPAQEYLDRQSTWNLVIRHKGGADEDGDAFVALAVEINGWILWLNSIDF